MKTLRLKFSISQISIVLPLIVLFLSEYFRFVEPDWGAILKFTSLLLMIGVILKFHKIPRYFAEFSIVLSVILFAHVLISFSYLSAIEELIRYLFPIIVLLYGFSLRQHLDKILSFLILFLLLNHFFQIINYLKWLSGEDQWFYVYDDQGFAGIPEVSGILRATGLLGFFSTFGFFNLIMFFVLKEFYYGKYKKTLLRLTIAFLFLSLSYKAIGIFLFLIFIFLKEKLRIVIYSFLILSLTLFLFPEKMGSFWESALSRFDYYVFEGNSARTESYRVMFSESNLFLGQGLGSFGGPSSVKYKSPFYNEVNFDWYGQNLSTTDTYFPHLFIEIGILGSLFYLFVIITPLIFHELNVKKFKVILIIYVALFIDSLVSYSINNLTYLALSLLLVYPIIFYGREKKEKLLSNVGESSF